MGFLSKLKERLFGRNKSDSDMDTFNRSLAEAERRVAEAVRAGADAAPIAPGADAVRVTYGVTTSDPILCNMPAGEHVYIALLRCPHGHRFGGSRRGSMSGKCSDPRGHVSAFPMPSENPAEECIVDCYELVCEGGEYSCTLYFDMYHPNAPAQPAPRGLTRE